ncbi:MAG: hypothetical protein EAX90_05945 [Candidatus Heimdallarchaeota archaeon]|nr:hypothetical protein [Candidatus Heimdallarchaeota archaeon]
MNQTEDTKISPIEEEKPNLCYWCHQIGSEEKPLYLFDYTKDDDYNQYYSCSSEHELKVLKYYNFITKWRIFYYLLIFFIPLCLLFLLVIFNWNFIFAYPIFVSFGLGLIIFPNLSQKTIDGIGLRRTNILSRILGGILVAIGLTLFIINGVKIFVPT